MDATKYYNGTAIDIVAAMICGLDSVLQTQVRLAGGQKSITKNINIEELAKQTDAYEEIRSEVDDRVSDIALTYIEQHGNSAKPNIIARKFCTRCGAAVPADAKFCSQCGA